MLAWGPSKNNFWPVRYAVSVVNLSCPADCDSSGWPGPCACPGPIRGNATENVYYFAADAKKRKLWLVKLQMCLLFGPMTAQISDYLSFCTFSLLTSNYSIKCKAVQFLCEKLKIMNSYFWQSGALSEATDISASSFWTRPFFRVWVSQKSNSIYIRIELLLYLFTI